VGILAKDGWSNRKTGDKYTVRSFVSVIPWGDQIKGNDMAGLRGVGRAYGVHVE
jgi:hypothetical protein